MVRVVARRKREGGRGGGRGKRRESGRGGGLARRSRWQQQEMLKTQTVCVCSHTRCRRGRGRERGVEREMGEAAGGRRRAAGDGSGRGRSQSSLRPHGQRQKAATPQEAAAESGATREQKPSVSTWSLKEARRSGHEGGAFFDAFFSHGLWRPMGHQFHPLDGQGQTAKASGNIPRGSEQAEERERRLVSRRSREAGPGGVT